MHIERMLEIDAEPDRAWAVLTDVGRWPELTASVTKVSNGTRPVRTTSW